MRVHHHSTKRSGVRYACWLLIAVFFALLVFILLWNLVAPSYAVRSIKNAMAQNCITCRIAIDHPSLGLWPGRPIRLTDVMFYGGEHDHSEVQVIADDVTLEWRPLALFRHQFILKSVTIAHPVVVLSEGKTESRFTKDDHPPAYYNHKTSDWTFEVDHIIIEDASFTYRFLEKGHQGEIHATNLSGQATRWGTTSAELKKSVGEAEVSGIIEKTAHATLKVAMPVLETEKQHIDVDLAVKNLDLSELTYFPTNEGVTIKGQVLAGHAQIFIRDKAYNAKTHVEYKNLDIKIEKSSGESGLARFFSNLVVDIIKRPSTIDLPPEKQTSETNGTRVEGETIVHFILRGLKESIMKQAVPIMKPKPPKAKKK